MQSKKNQGSAMGILLPMGLICLFAFCSLALALMGGRAYKSIQTGIDDGYGTTVAAAYLRTKLSQNNDISLVSLTQEDGYDVLNILSEQNGEQYLTRIYLHEGALKESFQPASTAFSPGSGATVAYVNECRFSLDGKTRLFRADMKSEEGTATHMAFALAGGERG